MALILITASLSACLGGGQNGGDAAGLTGAVRVDGSSTVFPITEAVGEEFQILHRRVKVTVGVSGTGGGFKKFCTGETDISDASRPIKEVEKADCQTSGIGYIELPVAFDGLSVMVNPENDFVTCLTTDELKKIWGPESTVTKWSDIRADWPDGEIRLFGPGTDSGTFDYFTETIVGESGASRPDYTASEDDNVLVQGIAGEKNGMGYFGYAYYVENTDKLKLVAVDGGNGCVMPSEQTINDGTYSPLSRHISIYVNKESLSRPEIKEFVKFYLENAPELVPQVGYVSLTPEKYEEGLSKTL